ncbi:MAG: hypothetical protein ABI824_07420 [Acidobacteriota bacterium]
MRKRSLTVLLTLGTAACSSRPAPDPCDKNSWAEDACKDAVEHQGYYSHGTFIPRYYSNPYPFYYDSYGGFLRSGGRPSTVVSPGVYAHPSSGSSSSSSPSSSGVTRGGFGSTGSSSGHSSGVGA